jgi:hypothetical protein
MTNRSAIVLLLLAAPLLAQKYAGPVPEKEDLPYIIQADNLIPTDAGEAKEQSGKKDEKVYIIDGVAAKAQTPLASPIFLIKTKELVPEKLTIYKLEVKNGHREITFRDGKRAKNPEPVHVNVRRVTEGLYRIEISDSLANGQYSITPQGANDVFCFEIF